MPTQHKQESNLDGLETPCCNVVNLSSHSYQLEDPKKPFFSCMQWEEQYAQVIWFYRRWVCSYMQSMFHGQLGMLIYDNSMIEALMVRTRTEISNEAYVRILSANELSL